MEQLTAALLSMAIAIITAVTGVIVSQIKMKKVQGELDSIKSAIDDGGGVYYVECPYCGKRIYLQSMQIKVDKEQKKGAKYGTD